MAVSEKQFHHFMVLQHGKTHSILGRGTCCFSGRLCAVLTLKKKRKLCTAHKATTILISDSYSFSAESIAVKLSTLTGEKAAFMILTADLLLLRY